MTTAGPTSSLAARSNEKKKGRNLVFGSDGTRVLDRGVWKKFKYCSQCNLIMVERAKWKNFDEVKYCSDKCRNTAKRGSGGGGGSGKSEQATPDSRKREEK
ncbi:hypothetical protein Ndes2526B_g01058 [Nannochloris sp. 'desiccata']